MKNKSAEFSEPLFNIFILPALLMAGIYFLHGFYDDAIDDSYRIVFMKALTTEKPFTEWFVYHIFISQVFVWLYKMVPGIPWFGTTFVFFTYLALVNCCYVLRYFLKQAGLKTFFIPVFLSLLFYLFWTESLLLYYMMTKVAVLACGFALMGSVIALRENGWAPRTILILFANWMIFLFALLARYEMVWMALPVAALFTALLRNGKKQLLPVFGPAVVLCVLLMMYLRLNPTADQRDMNLHEPYIFTFLDSHHGKTLAEQETLADSVKFIALKNWFFVDRQEFDLAFLSKASNPTFLDINALPRWKEKLNTGATEIWNDVTYRSLPVLIINGLLILFALVALIFLSCRGMLFFLLYHVLFWAFILTITASVKMEFRALDPLLAVYSMASLALFISRLESDARVWLLLAGLTSVLLLPREYRYNRDLAAYEATEVELVDNAWKEIDELFQGKILVPDISANLQLSLSKPPFRESKLSKHNKIIPFDSGYSTFHTTFREEMEKLAGSASFGDFYKYLFANRQDVIFISTPERLLLIQAYLKVIYGDTYCFKILNQGTALSPLQDYGLRKEFHYYAFDDAGTCEVDVRAVF